MWTGSGCNCSAEWPFRNHWLINNHVPPHAHLFTFETEASSFSSIKKTWILLRCNEIWSACGLQALDGHSFHIGGTTHLLLMGVDPFIVMVQGQWKPTAFLKYWQS